MQCLVDHSHSVHEGLRIWRVLLGQHLHQSRPVRLTLSLVDGLDGRQHKKCIVVVVFDEHEKQFQSGFDNKSELKKWVFREERQEECDINHASCDIIG